MTAVAVFPFRKNPDINITQRPDMPKKKAPTLRPEKMNTWSKSETKTE